MTQAVPGKVTNWGKIKDIKIPFDTYLVNGDGTKTFIPMNTWISTLGYGNTNNPVYTFIVPVWVEEGIYTIETRVVAENCPDMNNSSYIETNTGKNGNITHYVARKTINVEVIGKIYDLRVSACDDPAWNGKIKGTEGNYITAMEFPFGQKGQNTITTYQYAPKLGYSFVFDFKTKGRKSNNIAASIYPEYYFISKNGGNAEKVDLYYKPTTSGAYVKIDEKLATQTVKVKIASEYMRVPVVERTDSARIYNLEIGSAYNYANIVKIGTFANMVLPHSLRLCYNNFNEYTIGNGNLYGKAEAQISADALATKRAPAETGRDNVIGSVGHWYAGFYLPNTTVAVTPGTDIKKATAGGQTKKNGYILVRFGLKTKFNEWDYLKYNGPDALNEGDYNNRGPWVQIVGGQLKPIDYPQSNPTKTTSEKVQLPNGQPGIVPKGTIIMYETDLKANVDSTEVGVH